MKSKGISKRNLYEKYEQKILEHQFQKNKKMNDSEQRIIFSQFSNQRIQLSKVSFKQKIKQCPEYTMYICKIDSTPAVCKIYLKQQIDLNKYAYHKNIAPIQKILCVVQTEHKVFVFFKYLYQINRINETYLKNLIKKILQNIEQFKQMGLMYPEIQKKQFLYTKQGIFWRQFRYQKTTDITLHDKIQYFAPEKLKNNITTFQTNIYALGILLYELIYSKKPFQHFDIQIALFLKKNSQILFPKYYYVQSTEQIKDFISTCINFDDHKRFNNIKQVMDHPWISGRKN